MASQEHSRPAQSSHSPKLWVRNSSLSLQDSRSLGSKHLQVAKAQHIHIDMPELRGEPENFFFNFYWERRIFWTVSEVQPS